MEFDEYDYLERTVENPEPLKVRETANAAPDTVKSGQKDHSRSSKHKSHNKDGNEDRLSKRRSRSGDETRDHHQHREGRSSRHRSLSRDAEGDQVVRDHKDRERSREERNGKDRDKDRDRERDPHRDRRDHDRNIIEKDRERERSRRSSSRSEQRHRSDRDERDRERSRDREVREREREREIRERDRESRKKKEDAAEPESDPERDQRTVFAYQISLKADERDVFNFFSRAGTVRDVRLIMDRNSRRSKGVGYIEFYDAMSVPMAIALSGQLLLGQPVMVKPSEAEKNQVQSTGSSAGGSGVASPYPGGARRLYVGNLHANLTEEQLRQVFEAFGAVELVQLPLDETGHCKGFGFVQFQRLEDAKNALNLNGQIELAGRVIKVSTVTDHSGVQDAGTNPTDLDDDDGSGLALNAHTRALLIEKLARGDPASSITGFLTTTGMTIPTTPVLGTPPLVFPAVAPLIPALPGFPGGLQLPSVTGTTADTIGVPSECLLLKNMFDPKAETEPDFDLDIKEDVQEECSKFGNLKHIYVDKNSTGFVYLRFENTEAAIKAQRALHGRWFAGKMITATFMVPLTYEAKFPNN